MQINFLLFSILKDYQLPGSVSRAASEMLALICLFLALQSADIMQHVALVAKISAWHQILWYKAACFVSTSASSSCPK